MSEGEYFESILASLKKPQSSKRALQVLVALRKQLNSPDYRRKIQTVQQRNCLKPLVACTRHDGNAKIVDLALSILGNCCLDLEVCKATVNELNLLSNLNIVLEKHDKDSIRGRVFRILGNLCDGVEPLTIIEKEPSIIEYTLKYLKTFDVDEATEIRNNDEDGTKATQATVSMALRLVRKLIVRNTEAQMFDEQRMLSAVGEAFVKCSNSWVENKRNDVLINEVLKIMQLITSSTFWCRDVIIEFKTINGNPLDSLGDIILLSPEKIVKMVLKLARKSRYQSDLPSEKIFINLINAIEPSRLNTKHLEYLSCINKLMDHAGFHDKLNKTDGISLLADLFKNFKSDDEKHLQCCIYICLIFNKCRYNENLIRAQLNAGVVLTIIEKLEMISGESSSEIVCKGHETEGGKKVSRRNYKRIKREFNEENTGLTLNLSSLSNKKADRCTSPSSCSDISSVGPFSPMPSTSFACDDSDSDNYSPLCSENEADDDFQFPFPAADDIVSPNIEEQVPVLTQDQVEMRRCLRNEMNVLLKFYCTLRPTHPHLGSPKLVRLLMNIGLRAVLNREICNSTFNVIDSIADTKEFLLQLMLSGVIPQIYEVMRTREDCCENCKLIYEKIDDIVAKFLKNGSLEYIKGEIAYWLLGKTRDEVKEQLALAIPYVIRHNSTLNKLLLNCGGLSILIRLLRNQSNVEMQQKSIKSICTLATDSLKIKNPVEKKPKADKSTHHKVTKIKVDLYESPVECEDVVQFLLDDGTVIRADREELNKKSDYFNALLSGSFMESEQSEIVLKDVLKNSLNCLLQLMKLDIKSNTILEFCYDFETVLDVVLLSDRFLLTDLNYCLICNVEQRIAYDTVPIVYKWSLESGTNIMRIESVAFALVGNTTYREKLDLFYTLFDSGYFVELVDDVEKLIMQFL